MQNNNLPSYLESINWDKQEFTNDVLETILVASCLRFLGGLTEVSFVLQLSETIRKREKDSTSLPLHYATAILHDLTQELKNNTILSTDKETLRKNIDNAQKLITKRSVLELV